MVLSLCYYFATDYIYSYIKITSTLLHNSSPRRRQVSYYANILCISAKHLSHVCKQHCDKTASELIDLYVIEDIQTLLGNMDKTVKEIAEELGFASTSSFGRYVKQHLGKSPIGYRKKLYTRENCESQTNALP